MIANKRKRRAERRRRQVFDAMAQQAETVVALDRKGRPRERRGKPVLFPAAMAKV